MNSLETTADALRKLSVQDFQAFGADHIGYVKPVTVENRKVYALYAADGRLLTMQDHPEIAMMAARHNGIEPVVVH